MAGAKNPHRAWLLSHNPMARPLGCNGRYGPAGPTRHRRRGEAVCERCRQSVNHYKREAKRGNPGTGRRLKPCGTNAAAKRHHYHGEPLCFLCKVAEANYKSAKKARARKRKKLLTPVGEGL